MITMRDIARETGVSRATVSYVLNGRCGEDLKISGPIIRKIQATAKQMGYVRNELVTSVKTGKSRVIAVISDFPDYMLPAVKGCVEEAAKHGYLVKMIFWNNNDINAAIMQAVEFRVAGIFAISLPEKVIGQIDPKFFGYGIPSLGLTPHTGYMAFDQKKSAGRGTEYLIRKGFSDILYFSGICESPITLDRKAGYEEAMERHGLPKRFVFSGRTAHDVDTACDRILELHPAAVQCSNDHMALTLLHACYLRKLFVPEYFSVLGFGNIPGSADSSPFLTTVNEPYYETGQIMFRKIYGLITGQEVSDTSDLIGEVIERESVRTK